MDKKLRILIVDDEVQMTDLLKEIVDAELGCNAVECNDSTKALQLLSTESFDFVSLDHRMPKLTGMALLKMLRNQPGPNQHIPAIIFTGYLEEAKAETMAVYENVLFLEKPVKMDRYMNNVKLALKMKSENQAS